MEKKYRLEINYSEITEDNFDTVKELRKHDLDRNIVDDSMTILQFIKPSWLTEIKEPMSFEEWESQNYANLSNEKAEITVPTSFLNAEYRMARKTGWFACLRNQKLGVVVDTKEDFRKFEEEVFKFNNKDEETIAYTKSEWVWFCALKYARGLK